MKKKVELLAPAGSVESMAAAVNAGADAVYMGGSRFGARAYAENAEEDRFLDAIDFVHLHGCKLYMTVNTLVKETELDQLFDFLNPYYKQGLDAAIVQDLGVLAFIRRYFPELPVHASTQMTVTGVRGARLLKELGAVRVVTARELSLPELRQIHEEADIEIESFVHGALCYCYSGQCLLSSLIGGRSGNRGRCAQPCRLPYGVAGEGKARAGQEPYLLNLKDLCTLDILPDILEAGVYSLKIEGRMKSPRYTAGVVSIYRKYVDRYLAGGREGYRVDPKDRQRLLDLFDRGGFTEGYYRQHNGRDMVAIKEKPAFREVDQALFDRLDREYVNGKKQEPVCGEITVEEGKPSRLTLWPAGPEAEVPGSVLPVTVSGAAAQTARNQPLTEERLLKQITRTGDSPFYFRQLTARIYGSCFLTAQAMDELRRQGLEALREAILKPYRRADGRRPGTGLPGELPVGPGTGLSGELPAGPGEGSSAMPAARMSGSHPGRPEAADRERPKAADKERSDVRPSLHVSLEEPEGLTAVLPYPEIEAVYIDACGFGAETWAGAVRDCHAAGKRCALLLPHIFRREAERYFMSHERELGEAGFDELVIRSLEEVTLAQELGLSVPLVSDAGLYAMNHLAAEQLTALGIGRLTLPLELNSTELAALGCEGRELVGYGYLPAMVSAQCIRKTLSGCTRRPEILRLKDRTGRELPVKNHCRFCYNTIYNPSPLSLLGQEKLVERLAPAVLRLSFTIEGPEEIRRIVRAFVDSFRYGKETGQPVPHFTRGHMKRGVE